MAFTRPDYIDSSVTSWYDSDNQGIVMQTKFILYDSALSSPDSDIYSVGRKGQVLISGGSTEPIQWGPLLDSAAVTNIVLEQKSTLSGTSVSVDIQAFDVYTHTLTGNTVYTFTNAASANIVTSFIMVVTSGGSYSITWPNNINWAGGAAPPAPTSGNTDVYVFMTYDGGSSYFGFTAAEDTS